MAEALPEKVQRGELLKKHANRICRQIMREDALKLFPKLSRMLWRKETQSRHRCIDAVHDVLDSIFFVDDSGFVVGHVVAIETRGDTLPDRWVW